MALVVENLKVSVEGKEVVSGASIEVPMGKIVALVGPNGSGKTSLGYAIAGHPSYTIDGGKVSFLGKNITYFKPDEKANLGIFLGFQSPPEVTGVGLFSYLREISKEKKTTLEFKESLDSLLKSIGLSEDFSKRYLNEGFSGGEKKKSEVLQLILRNPKIAILDEPDSGLDVDGIKMIGETLTAQKKRGTGFLLITHHEKILSYLKPDKVYVLLKGKMAREGGQELVGKIQDKGYAWMKKKGGS